MAGVEYQVTKVDPTDPETKGMVYQVHKVTEEVAATMDGKVYRARIIKDPTEPTVAGKVYQIVLIGDPDDPSVKGKVYNAILTGDSEVVVVGPAVSPLNLPDAIAGSLTYVKAFGGIEQNGTPTPDTPMNIVCNNGTLKARRPSGLPLDYQQVEWLKSTQMIELDKPTKDTYELQSSIYREDLTTQYIYQSDTTSSGTTNTTAYLSATVGNWRFDGQTKTVYVPELEQVITKQNKNGIWLNDTQIDTYTNVNSFTSTNNLRLFGTQSTPAMRLYWFKMLENETLVYDIIPVRKISTNELGVYDKVSGQFFTNSNATLTAGNDISDPIEVYADGTVETINMHGKNLFNQNTAVIGAYINASGQIMSEATGMYSDLIPVQVGASYTYSGTVTDSGATKRIHGYLDGVWVQQLGSVYAGSNESFSKTVTIPNGINGIRISGRKSDLYTQVEKGSTATDYEAYFNGGTATVEMLLKIGGVVDEQEILGGNITRKVGYVVLDGTENWSAVTNGYSAPVLDASLFNHLICTHFVNGIPTTDLTCSKLAGSADLLIHYDAMTTVSAFKAFLASKYANGTPVIVLYCLENEITESVAGQTLQVTDGDNTLEITQASLSDLELEAEYEKEAE